MKDKHNISVIATNEKLGFTEEHVSTIDMAIRAALEHEKVAIPCDVYVMITDNEGIRQLNCEHRGLDRPTDVLSFPMQDLVPGQEINPSPLEIDPQTGLYMLGDMVISFDKAKEQAEEYGHSIERELAFLAVHSILHLLGYDHEKGAEEETAQFETTEAILTKIGLKREA